MKKSILYLFLILTQSLNAQEVLKTTFHSKHDLKTSQEKSVYTRVIQPTPTEGIYSFTETWKDGALKREGFATEFEPKFKQIGKEVTYHKNGQVSMIQHIKHVEEKRTGTMRNKNGEINTVQYTSRINMSVGNIQRFYENGKLKEEGTFLKPTVSLSSSLKRFDYPNYAVIQIADSLGNKFLDSFGNGKVNITFANGNRLKGEYVKGLKHGQHKEYHAKNKDTHVEQYKNGKFIKGQYTDSLGNKTNYKGGRFNSPPNFKPKFKPEPNLWVPFNLEAYQ